MKDPLIDLLSASVAKSEKAAARLEESFVKVHAFIRRKRYSSSQLEILESFSARFARLNDLLVKQAFRTIERIDLDESGTYRDSIILAEKKDLIESAGKFLKAREVRNLISHEYEDEEINALYKSVFELTPVLLDSVKRVKKYILKYKR